MNIIVDRFIKKYGRLPTERDPDYLEMLRMSKYRVLPFPAVKPGKCSNCGSCKQDGRAYVDFSLEIDWYGVVYLCSLCLTDIANNVGLFQPLQQEIAALKQHIEKQNALEQQGIAIQNTVLHTFEEVKKYFANLHASGNHTDSDISPGVGTSETVSNNSGTDESEQGTAESAPSSGSEDVPSLTKLLNSR